VALTDAGEFVAKIREILEEGFGTEFMKEVHQTVSVVRQSDYRLICGQR
jgi:hypothetical protein